jgi:tRNA1(Val) A37 N6-methylase TrmN6
MTSTWDAEVTEDAFLGGQLRLLQPAKGYRAGVAAVLLAAAVPAKAGETVLELGCGVGVAALCLAKRTGAHVTGLELQERYAALASRNAEITGLGFHPYPGDLRQMPAELRAQSFDHVLANPPFFDRAQGSASDDPDREAARGEAADLTTWIDTGTKRLRPKGTLTVILQADRLPDLLRACDGRLGDLKLLPVQPRAGRPAELILLQARKGARGAFQLLPPLILHSGDRHEDTGLKYRPEVERILRDAAPLSGAFSPARAR